MNIIRAFLAFLLLPGLAGAVPLSTIGSFCGLYPDQCMKGTESLLAVRGTGTNAYYVLEADPTTGAIPVSASVSIASVGPTGAAVPSSADYSGLNYSGTLIGAVGDISGRTIVVGPGTAGTALGGVLTVQGVTSMTPLLSAQSGTWTVQPGNTANTTAWLVSEGGRPITGAIVASNAYASTNVTTGAYVELIAATANAINNVCVSDSSGRILKIGTGAAASEVARIYLQAGGSGCFNLAIPAATRISLETLDATASSGYFLFTGY